MLVPTASRAVVVPPGAHRATTRRPPALTRQPRSAGYRERVPLLRRLVLAVLSAVALCLAFPDAGVWVLAPVGVALLAAATRGASVRVGALLGFVTGAGFFGYSLSWAGIVVGVVPWAGLVVLQSLFLAVLGAVTAWAQGRPLRRVPLRPSSLRDLRRSADADSRVSASATAVRPLVVALAWVGQEALRDRIPYGGFPWVRLAFSQADSPLGRLAALGGAPLVTFAVALAGGLLAAAAYRRAPVPALVAPAVSAVGAVAVVLVGLAVPLPVDGAPSSVMAVQGNVARPGLEFNAERRQVLDNHVDATLAAAQQVAAGTRARPDVVVWPENSSDIDPTRNPDADARITEALDAVGAPIVVGALLEQPAPDVSNVSLLYTPGQGITDEYVKQHPVPFAEYIPSRDFFRRFSDKVDLVRSDFAPGDRPVVFRVPSAAGGTIVAGPSICFEVAYDDLVRDNVQLGANLLLVQTNNATFGYTAESTQQLAISRLRAIEHGRSVVHVSTVGVSALITPDGTAHQESALFTRAVLSGSLPRRTTLTVATVVGPWPEYAACALFVVLLGLGLVRRTGGTGPRTRRVDAPHPTTVTPEGPQQREPVRRP